MMNINIYNTTQKTILFLMFVFMCVLMPDNTAHASLTDGLVGHWTFDGKDTTWTSSTTGTTRDLSGNGNTGTLTNMNRATAPKTGKIGQGMNFDGVNDYAQIPDADMFTFSDGVNDRPFSLSAWVYYVSAGGNEPGAPIVSKYNSYSPFHGEWEFFISSDDKFNFQTLGSGTTVRCGQISNSTIPKNTWVHVSAVYDGSGQDEGITLYVNGVLTPSTGYGQDGTYTAMQNRASPVAIGAAAYSGGLAYSGYLNGKTDDVRIYNRALSATEITQLYKLGGTKMGVTPSRNITSATSSCTGISCGLVGHWTFDGKDTTWTSATAGTVRDVSGSNDTGTLSGMNRATAPKLGRVGQGLSFDGVNDSITSLSASVREYTLSFWLKRQNLGASGYNSVISCAGTTGSGYYGWYDSGLMRWCYTNGSGFATNRLAGSGSPASDTWVHIVMSVGVSGTTMSMMSMKQYFNNKLINTDSSASGLGTTTFTTLGVGNANLKGTLDDFRIYNRVLSASEIAQLYKQGATKLGVSPSRNVTSASTTCTGISCGLVGHWTFDGKDTNWTASTTYNIGSAGNNGTLIGLSATSSARIGKRGQGFFFGRSATSTVSIGNSPSLINDFSISFWTYPTVSQNSVGFVSNYNGFGGAYVRIFDDSFAHRFVAGVSLQNVSAPKLTPNKWYYITAVRDSVTGVLSLYHNGILVGASNPGVSLGALNYSLNGKLGFGGGFDTSGQPTAGGCGCILDDVRIYNRVLSASEIRQLYKSGQRRTR